ncbi:class I SAM-dependent methyltransferase [Bacillus sp. es.034]|uniref:class I SAM-dependent methyltransferase n=1 Tax=Bacillus sp. es.034 TaxID=1761763 RepID=UPI000BF70AA4|nr:class I SAM-dependent methyltransferase [Bacillus sp. es.034]PFG03529.1 ubiquinone/menaquinone biosynthesis C-methylase UbiE [Bacillus sp. es.034]
MNNRWNEIIYKLWSPMYDRIFNTGKFLEARQKLFHHPPFHPHQRILFVGVGTGADLELLDHTEFQITAIDYSGDMLQKAKEKFKDNKIEFIQMDAQQMSFTDNSFDAVVGSLILSVVPDPDRCMKEIIRVLKPQGTMIIFDKFSPSKMSLSKRMVRPFVKMMGTDIGVNFENLYEQNHEAIILKEDEPLLFKGMYRKIILTKTGR